MPTSTPWGAAQSSRQIARGITYYSTARHGGILVTPRMVAKMPEPIRSIIPFAGPGAYEEDCDWALVALAFPEYWGDQQIKNAYETAKAWHHTTFDVDAFVDASPTLKAIIR